MKEKQFEEHKHLMELLDAQREQILIEKTKLETMERLKTPSNSSTKRHSELDAAIKIAQVSNTFSNDKEKFKNQCDVCICFFERMLQRALILNEKISMNSKESIS